MIVAAIRGDSIPSTALVAACALIVTLILARQQRTIARREYVAKLHLSWWSNEFEKDRGIVFREMETWKTMKDESPVIKHYLLPGSSGWTEVSDERRAHGKILFFFADLNSLLEKDLIDPYLTFKFFGPSQYDYFKEYFAAIRIARVTRPPAPRWVKEAVEFERRLQAWKVAHPSEC